MVEFVPADCVAPSGDDCSDGVFLAGCGPRGLDVFVGGYDFHDLGCWQRVLGVHVAPPEHCFDPPGQAHSPVVTQYLP